MIVTDGRVRRQIFNRVSRENVATAPRDAHRVYCTMGMILQTIIIFRRDLADLMFSGILEKESESRNDRSFPPTLRYLLSHL